MGTWDLQINTVPNDQYAGVTSLVCQCVVNGKIDQIRTDYIFLKMVVEVTTRHTRIPVIPFCMIVRCMTGARKSIYLADLVTERVFLVTLKDVLRLC